MNRRHPVEPPRLAFRNQKSICANAAPPIAGILSDADDLAQLPGDSIENRGRASDPRDRV